MKSFQYLMTLSEREIGPGANMGWRSRLSYRGWHATPRMTVTQSPTPKHSTELNETTLYPERFWS